MEVPSMPATREEKVPTESMAQTFDLKQYKFADGPENVAVINTGVKEGAADLSRDSQRGAEPNYWEDR